MRTVILTLKKRDEEPVSKRNRPTASGIARRDKEVLRQRAKVAKRPRGIPDSRVDELMESLPVYPEGKREHVFTVNVVRHDRMFSLLGIQSKGFFQWLSRGKVPYAAYCICTGRKGYPPKAYLEEEARALVTALNTHYVEHLTFRDTDIGLRRNIHAALNMCRDRKEKELCQNQ